MYLFASCGLVIGFLIYQYFDKSTYYKLKALYQLYKSINVTSDQKEYEFILGKNGKYAIIKTPRGELYIPYNKRKQVSLSEFQLYAIFNDGTRENITQRGSFPYLISAEDLSADRIIAQNNGSYYEFTGNNRPLYVK